MTNSGVGTTPGRVLITGGGGFVGRALANGFAELGWTVAAVDLGFDGPPEHPSVSHTVADLSNGDWAVLPDADVVVHAAWITTGPTTLGVTEAEHAERNLAPLTTMLGYATHRRLDAFVFVSSSGVFAADDAEDGLTDAVAPTGSSPYASTKLRGEMLAATWGSEGLSRTHVVRLGYLFGPGEVVRRTRHNVSLVAQWMSAARDGRPMEVRADDPARDWTFTPDLAPALARLISGPSVRRPIHLGSGHVVRDLELAGCVADAFPGAEIVRTPAGPTLKPPMVPSDVSALSDFIWTDPATGVRSLLEAEAIA